MSMAPNDQSSKIGWLSTSEDQFIGKGPVQPQRWWIYAEPWVIGSPYPTNVGVATIRLEALHIFNALGGFMASCSYKVSWGWLDFSWMNSKKLGGPGRNGHSHWTNWSSLHEVPMAEKSCLNQIGLIKSEKWQISLVKDQAPWRVWGFKIRVPMCLTPWPLKILESHQYPTSPTGSPQTQSSCVMLYIINIVMIINSYKFLHAHVLFITMYWGI